MSNHCQIINYLKAEGRRSCVGTGREKNLSERQFACSGQNVHFNVIFPIIKKVQNSWMSHYGESLKIEGRRGDFYPQRPNILVGERRQRGENCIVQSCLCECPFGIGGPYERL